MSELRVRNMEEWVIAELKTQAKTHGRSLEAEVRQGLRDLVLRRKRELGSELRAELAALQDKYGQFSDSAALIREDREARG